MTIELYLILYIFFFLNKVYDDDAINYFNITFRLTYAYDVYNFFFFLKKLKLLMELCGIFISWLREIVLVYFVD